MIKSKYLILVIGVLVLCLAVASYVSISDNSSPDDSNSDDVVYIWMEDSDGNVKLTPTTNTYSEGCGTS